MPIRTAREEPDDVAWPEQGEGAAGGGPAAHVGARLRAARERMGWALSDVAATLRIRESLLRDLEAGRVERLPAPAYAIGFVRSYAALLGLDPDEMAHGFRAEFGGTHRYVELQFPVSLPERAVPRGGMLLLGLLIALGAYGAWYWRAERRPAPPPETVAADRVLGATAEEEEHPLPPPSAGAASATGTAQATAQTKAASSSSAEASPPAPSPVPSPAPAGSASPAQASTSPVPAPPAVLPAGAGAAPAPAAETGGTGGSASAPPPSAAPAMAVSRNGVPAVAAPVTAGPAGTPPHVLLRAHGDSWVEIKDGGGKILLNRVLHAGDQWTPPDGAGGLTLTTGNAGGIDVLIDGRPAPALGGNGVVRRNVRLDADLLRSEAGPGTGGASSAAAH
jgi:cytoskeleton protein RodZ